MKTNTHSPDVSSSYYITCPRKKGRPKKHVYVCRKCRRNTRCKTYQDHIQPGLFPGW